MVFKKILFDFFLNFANAKITGEPVLLFGSTPAHCSDGVFALLSLIAPLSYGGELSCFAKLFLKKKITQIL